MRNLCFEIHYIKGAKLKTNSPIKKTSELADALASVANKRANGFEA
jgi:hypothetical protein